MRRRSEDEIKRIKAEAIELFSDATGVSTSKRWRSLHRARGASPQTPTWKLDTSTWLS